ncbi:hypothetical protein GOD03_17295, partial [Sinorhizobium medicae]|nr:hypothetical protein [Sinorhizobium medicae]
MSNNRRKRWGEDTSGSFSTKSDGARPPEPAPWERREPSHLISKSGLYKLALRSDKPEAKDFQPLALRTGSPAWSSCHPQGRR